MSEQLGFAALARTTDPETSHHAASRVSHAISAIEKRILSVLVTGGKTTRELAEITGIDRVSLSPRMKPLEERLHVVRADRRDGSTVWQLNPWLQRRIC